MPNEFVARNGVIALNNSIITGSLNVSSGITGSLFGTASWASNAVTSSYILSAVSASFASTASFVPGYVSGSGTSGQVAYWNGTNTQTGNNNLFWDNTNGRLGIGTTSPSRTLIVAGGSIGITSDFNGLYFPNGSVYSGGGTFRLQNGTNYYDITNSNIQYWVTSNSERMRLFSTGNLSIGTTTDSGFRLDVSGSTRFNGNSIITGSLTVITGSAIEFQVTNTGVKIGNALVDTHTVTGSLNISGSENVRGSGSAVFSVDGTSGRLFQVDDSLSGSLFSVNTAGGLPVIEAFSDNTVRIGQFGQRALFVSQSRVGIGKETALNANLDVSGSVVVTGSLNVSGSITTTGTITAQTLVVQTVTSSVSFMTGSTRFGSLLANTHQFTGSVSMTGSLNVTGTGTFSSTLQSAAATNGNGLTVKNASNNNILNLYANGTNDGVLQILNASAVEKIALYGNDGAATFAGNVGIGTTSPSAKLHVAQSGGITSNNALFLTAGNNYNTSGSNQIVMGYNGSTDYAHAIKTRHQATNAIENGIDFYTWKYGDAIGTQAGQYVMTMAGNGNVGIGTTSPAYKLDVSGVGRVGDVFLITTATTSDARLEIGSGRSGNGNSYLDLIGDATYTDYGLRLIRYDTGANAISRLEHKGTGQLQLFTAEAGPITISTTSSERMRIAADGNVGIGTTSPGSVLSVAGAGGSTLGTNGYIAHIGGTDSNVDPVRYMIGFSHGNSLTSSNVRAAIGMMVTTGGNGNLVFETGASGAGQTERMRINGSGNVGIGTTSPSQKLQIVAGNIQLDDDYAIQWGGINNFILGSTASNYLRFYTNNSERIRINSAGNVGIGTTSPAYKLDVSGTSRFSSDILSNGNITIDKTSPYLTLNRVSKTGGDSIIAFTTGSVSAANYQFWIGTPSWANSGKTIGLFNHGLSNWIWKADDDSLDMYFTGNINVNSTVSLANISALFNNGGDDIYGNIRVIRNNSTIAQDGMYIGYNGTGTTNAHLRFYANGVTERMRIDASTGNVGVGTTTPSSSIEINKTAASTDAIGSGNNPAIRIKNTNSAAFNEKAEVQFTIGNSVLPTAAISNLYTSYTAGTQQGGDLVFSTRVAGSTLDERMRITAAGNVGIGATAPSNLLHLKAASNPVIRLEGASDSGYVDFNGTRLILSAGAGYMGFVAGTAEYMRLTSSGNVGIGTTSPAFKLDVSGSIAVGGAQALYNAATDNIYLNARVLQNQSNVVADGMYIGYDSFGTTNAHLRFYANGTNERMRIDASTGNVGIGTTSPQVKLDVVGTSTGTLTGMALFRDASTNGNGLVVRAGTGRVDLLATWINSGINTDLTFTPTTSGGTQNEAMRITSAGNVGIGTTSPAYKLDVIGDIRLRGYNIGVDSSNNIKYIFTNDGGASYINSGNVGIGTTSPSNLFEVNGISAVVNSFGAFTALQASGSTGYRWTLANDASFRLQYTTNGFAGLAGTPLYVSSSGNIGVGTTAPGYPLEVSGNVSDISIYASNDIVAYSDQSVKTNLEVISNAIDKIKQINGYTFERTDNDNKRRRAGVIAQEVEKVLPEVIAYNNDGTLGVAYGNMVALLIECIKEQQIQIDELKSKING